MSTAAVSTEASDLFAICIKSTRPASLTLKPSTFAIGHVTTAWSRMFGRTLDAWSCRQVAEPNHHGNAARVEVNEMDIRGFTRISINDAAPSTKNSFGECDSCLLYTSDAADEE